MGVHPHDKRDKNVCTFLGTSQCNEMVDPERQVPQGSYEIFGGNITNKIKEKSSIQNKSTSFFSEILLNFDIYSFSAAQNNQKNNF